MTITTSNKTKYNIIYIDEQHEYERRNHEFEEQRQLAFEQRENQAQSYEDWLSTQPQLMPFSEPQPSERLIDFKKKYLG